MYYILCVLVGIIIGRLLSLLTVTNGTLEIDTKSSDKDIYRLTVKDFDLMKKKYAVMSLLFIGVVLICVSVILSVISTSQKDIIGGAGFPTFKFVFFNQYGGLYSYLAFFGVVLIIASGVMIVMRRKNR